VVKRLVRYNSCIPLAFVSLLFLYALVQFLVAMFIVYFDYILSIVSLSLCLCISSYSIHPNKVPWAGGRDHISMVLICYLPMNTLYILDYMVNRGCDTPVESFVVHSPNIGHRSRAQLRRKGEVSILKHS
jgi:hypothetical protein